jgi:hypothetical protein
MHQFQILLLLCGLCSPAFAQGRLYFQNRDLFHPDLGGRYSAPVTFANGTPVGPSITAGLYMVQNGSESLVVTSPFSHGFPGEIIPVDVRIPGTEPGETAIFRVKVWETAAGSYEDALQNGFCTGIFPTVDGNNEVSVVLIGTPGPSPQVATLDGLLPFSLTCIPEPTTSAIFACGLILLLLRRRR